MPEQHLVPVERIERAILILRGHKERGSALVFCLFNTYIGFFFFGAREVKVRR